MGRILLFSLLGIIAGLPTGWYFGAAANRSGPETGAETEPGDPSAGPSATVSRSAESEPQPMVAELEFQVESLNSVLEETTRRYRILIESVERAGFPEFLAIGVGDTLALQADAQAFFGLTNRKAREIDGIGETIYAAIRRWELDSAELVETTDATVAYRIPANPALAEELAARYFENLVDVVGAEDGELLFRSAGRQFTGLEVERIVRIDSLAGEDSPGSELIVETDYLTADGVLLSRMSDAAAAVPVRYVHLFEVQ